MLTDTADRAPGPTADAALDEARRRASPRLTPPPGIAWPALLIHGGLTLLWLGLLARAFLPDSAWSWAAGFVYIGYDTALLLFVFWQTLPLLRHDEAPVTPLRPPSLAVVVAAHDEDEVLAATLKALLEQSDPPDRIVVADDGSGSRTLDLLARVFGLAVPPVGRLSVPAQAHPTLGWLRLPHSGKAMALNQTIAMLDQDVVLTVDADTLLDRHAIGAMRQAFARDPSLVAARGSSCRSATPARAAVSSSGSKPTNTCATFSRAMLGPGWIACS